MKTCPSCNSRIDEALVICPHCGHDFARGQSAGGGNKTMMGFPAIADILANEPEEEPEDTAKHTLFGFPAHKVQPVVTTFAEESDDDDDDGEATSLIPADQLQREFEADSSPAAVEAHEPRMTMAGIPVSKLGKAPNIKGAWGLDEESDGNSTSVVPASSMFGQEQPGHAGYSKRVESSEFPSTNTLMGMSLDDIHPASSTQAKPDDDWPAASTQFAVPAAQIDSIPPEADPDPRDSGPDSGEASTHIWNPADELGEEENTERHAVLQKIRGDAADQDAADQQGSTRKGIPTIKADGTTEDARAIINPLGVSVPPPGKKADLGDTSSLRSRLQERLKGAIPPPTSLPKPNVPVAPANAFDEFEDIEDHVEKLDTQQTDVSKPPKPQRLEEPRSLSTSGVLGGGTYVVSRQEKSATKPIARIEPKSLPEMDGSDHAMHDTAPLDQDQDDFAFADTGITPAGALAQAVANENPAPSAPSENSSLRFPTPARPSTPLPGVPPEEPFHLGSQETMATGADVRPQNARAEAPMEHTPTLPQVRVSTDQLRPAEPKSSQPMTPMPQPMPARAPAAQTPMREEASDNVRVARSGPDKLINALRVGFGLLSALLLFAAAAVSFTGASGAILMGVFGAFGLLVAIISIAPVPGTAKTIGWILLGLIVVAITFALLANDQLDPIPGAFATGGGFAAVFASAAGILHKLFT